jgi:hypothetical protein
MQLVVAVVAVVGIAAVLIRFARPSPGTIKLPRIVDESIGMWIVRGIVDRLGPRSGAAGPTGRAATQRPDRARAFDAEMARLLGIRSAGEVAPVGPAGRRPRSRAADRGWNRPIVLALLVVVAIGAGAMLGAGVGLLAPREQSEVLAATATPGAAPSDPSSDGP